MDFTRRKGNIMVTFLLISVLALIIFSLFFMLGGRLKGVTAQSLRTKALYIAEAGVHKAIWYIATPVSQGGKGTSWRTAGLTENFAEGSYTMTVANASQPQQILITASGEAAGVIRALQVRITASSLPAAFDYALYNNGNLTVKGSVTIGGDVFANGNAEIKNPAVVSGNVFVPEGNTISGNGTYGVGGTLIDPPQMPYLDTSYYDGDIASARLQPAGDQTLSNLTLSDQTIYVNGNATVSGLTGSGKIVASGNITFSGDTNSPNITFIAGNSIDISGNTNVSGSILFGSSAINIGGTPRVQGSLLSASVKINGTPSVYGIVYAWEIGVEVGTANIYGSLVNPSSKTLTGNVSIVFDPAYLPSTPPPGMTAGGYRIVQGSWKEL